MIKEVYKGIPRELQEKILWVDSEFRTNPLSHEFAPYDVVVEYQNLEVLGYDNIHYTSQYIAKIVKKRVNVKYPDFKHYEYSEQLIIAKDEICRIFVRKRDEFHPEQQEFAEEWNNSSDELPWEALSKYDSNCLVDDLPIYQLTLAFDEFQEFIADCAGLGRRAYKQVGISEIRQAKTSADGRWVMVSAGDKLYPFPASKKLAVGTSPRDLSFCLTFPTEESQEVTFIACGSGGMKFDFGF